MKTKITLLLSLVINVILSITLYNNTKTNTSSIYGTFQCHDKGQPITLVFEEQDFTYYAYPSFSKKGTYKISDDKLHILELENETYFISLDANSFIFPVKEENETYMCKFIKVNNLPSYQID